MSEICNGFVVSGTPMGCQLEPTSDGLVAIDNDDKIWFSIQKQGGVYTMHRDDRTFNIQWRHNDMDPRLGTIITCDFLCIMVLDHADVIPDIPTDAEIYVIGTDLDLLLNLPVVTMVHPMSSSIITLIHYQIERNHVIELRRKFRQVWLSSCGNREMSRSLPITPKRIIDGFCLDNLIPIRSSKFDFNDWNECIMVSPRLRQVTIPGVSDYDLDEYLNNLDLDDIKSIMDAEITH